jgi:phosphoglucosamine mutase
VGVYIFPEQGLYPDSMGAVLRVLATLPDPSGIRSFVRTLPRVHLVKRKVGCPSPLKTRVMSRVDEMLMDALDVPADVTVNRTDGVRLEMQDAWVLVRPSGTEPVVRVTTESTDPARADYLALGADAIVTRLVAEAAHSAGTGGSS